jgi:class 3 adenylate cyclase/tetratricopeptide (TPR) repeat protein
VTCSKCNAENTAGAKFCIECGESFKGRCPKCGLANPANAKFCQECGTSFGSLAGPKKSESEDAPGIRISVAQSNSEISGGERKTVTALFADIKGSTALMEALDPEAAHALVAPVLRLMVEAVHRYEGYVARSTGDGIFALFGAPVAHEDHPQRALYAALRLQEELKRYSAKLREAGELPIEARVGANTGEVVAYSVETDGKVEYRLVGHTANLAARMEALAPTGSIAISEDTRKLVEGYFQLKALGPTIVKGVSEPVNVYEVTGLGPLRTRLQRSAGRGLTKFVGREREMEALMHAAAQAKSGHGQIVAAMAEPGVGKSRLYFEFKATSQSGWMVLETFSVSHGKASAYLPVIDLLRNYFDIAAGDDERKRREKVTGRILALDRSLEDTLPYLFSLLGIVEGDDPLAQMDGQIKKRRTLETIKRILRRESLNQPIMVIFEDLHWIDSETQELLNLLADSIGTAKILLLVNYRPEYSHQWNSKTYYIQLRLDPLGRESAEEMLLALLGDGKDLLPLKRLIIERTEGTPFFIEEIVQALFEDGVLRRNGTVTLVKSMSAVKVPATVQTILASRIDRLPHDEKELLQTLAVLGREFALSMVRRAVGKGADDDLDRRLADLQMAEFIYEQPATGDVEYTFKHALTQEVAYNSLLAERRKHIHERAAQAIESLFAASLADHYEELAHHYSRSDSVAKAVEYLERAGARAAQQPAHSEAIGYFTRALELLQRLPNGAARDSQELDLQMALSGSSFVAIGLRAFEREPALVRARELCERLGDNARLMEALLALAHLRFNQRDFEVARELAERVLAISEQAKAPVILAGAHSVLGLVRFATGHFAATREHFERAVELFATTAPRGHGALFAQIARNVLLAVLIFLGYPVTALGRTREYLTAARRSTDPFFLAFALLGDGMNHVWLRDGRMVGVVAERAEEVLSIATEHPAPLFLIVAAFVRGWAMVSAGRAEEGIAEMRRSVSDPMVAGAALFALLLAVLAETCGRNGRAEEGLDLVAKGLAAAEQTGMTVGEAELHRIKGDLLIANDISNAAEAERCIRTAIDVSRRQGARLFELRATTSLARLLGQQGNREEARTMLAEIYNWFTEGFDTADLKDAKALLDELSA